MPSHECSESCPIDCKDRESFRDCSPFGLFLVFALFIIGFILIALGIAALLKRSYHSKGCGSRYGLYLIVIGFLFSFVLAPILAFLIMPSRDKKRREK